MQQQQQYGYVEIHSECQKLLVHILVFLIAITLWISNFVRNNLQWYLFLRTKSYSDLVLLTVSIVIESLLRQFNSLLPPASFLKEHSPFSGNISCSILNRVLGLSLGPCLQSKSKSLNKAKTWLKQG